MVKTKLVILLILGLCPPLMVSPAFGQGSGNDEAELTALIPKIGRELPNLGFKTVRGIFRDPNCRGVFNEVGVVYPSNTGSRALDQRLQNEARTFFREGADNENFESNDCPGPDELPSRNYETSRYFSAYSSSRDYISIFTSDTAFGIGAAHPMHGYNSLNYNIKTDQVVEIRDLFPRTEESLARIWPTLAKLWCTKYNQDTLPGYYKIPEGYSCSSKNIPLPEQFRAGTNLAFDALGVAYLTRKGLVVMLDPYLGWSYSTGPIEVLLPKELLIRAGATREFWGD
ncbi:MAG: hypothetical protein LBP22_02025 [Deltaproteobacteria bacterium]|jgi:hypothetical protein|nr:hypothetical protein [Deltaproteobacteria bacterium]